MAKYGPDLNLPNAPTQYTNPLLTGDIAGQSALAKRLQSGDFTGDLSWLSGLTNPNSGYLKNALSAAKGALQPQFRNTIQDIQNSAAAAGSLNSSTFTDALSRAGSDLNSQYQSMVGNAAMQDYTNANNNRLRLFGSGLSLGQQAIGNEANQSNSTNAFNLENYGNIVAKAIQDNTNLQNYPDLASLLKQYSTPTGSLTKAMGSVGDSSGFMSNRVDASGNSWGSEMFPTNPNQSMIDSIKSSFGVPGEMYQQPQQSTYYQPLSPMYGSATTPYTKPGSAFLNSNLSFTAPKVNNSLFTKN